jgi:hypothetical protein
MRERVTIALSKPLTTHDGPLKAIVLREPTYDEYLAIGDPYLVAESPGGTRFVHENMENIRQYIALCLVEPKDPALLTQAGAFVAKQVKEGILGFFQPEALKTEGSENLQTISPSADTASGQKNSKG